MSMPGEIIRRILHKLSAPADLHSCLAAHRALFYENHHMLRKPRKVVQIKSAAELIKTHSLVCKQPYPGAIVDSDLVIFYNLSRTMCRHRAFAALCDYFDNVCLYNCHRATPTPKPDIEDKSSMQMPLMRLIKCALNQCSDSPRVYLSEQRFVVKGAEFLEQASSNAGIYTGILTGRIFYDYRFDTSRWSALIQKITTGRIYMINWLGLVLRASEDIVASFDQCDGFNPEELFAALSLPHVKCKHITVYVRAPTRPPLGGEIECTLTRLSEAFSARLAATGCVQRACDANFRDASYPRPSFEKVYSADEDMHITVGFRTSA